MGWSVAVGKPRLSQKLLEHLISEVHSRSGKAPDTVCVGTPDMANQVRSALIDMRLDMHIICDVALRPQTILVGRASDFAQF